MWSPRGWPSETPQGAADPGEIWCYTERFSYLAGETVGVRVHTTAPSYSVRIVRDGVTPEVVHEEHDLPGSVQDTPLNSYKVGCGWDVTTEFSIADEWRPGVYLIIVSAVGGSENLIESEHFFVLRSRPGHRTAPAAVLLATSTMIAYNDWGGANHYRGIGTDPREDVGEPVLSIERPIARGMLRKPAEAPRKYTFANRPPFSPPRYHDVEWARLRGFSRHHADAGWATYERNFWVWAEKHGYEFEALTQHDLHLDPASLSGYECVIIVGHDEYWTWDMRDALDRFVDDGGNVARFGGDFLWQVRLEDDGRRQACYRLPDADPITPSAPHLVTTIWEYGPINRPGATTMGLNGSGGIYNRYGAAAPRSSGGYTVYRPDHWSFAGTDVFYGDELGGIPVCIASFELDGVEYTFHRGLPYPTFEDGAPESLEILALTPAVLGEEDRWNGTTPLIAPLEEFGEIVQALGDHAPAYLRDRPYGAGSGIVATFTRGDGTVWNSGGVEWVRGLIEEDAMVGQITRNVLDRFIS